MLREGLPLWKLDVDSARLAIGYGAPHHAGQDWYLATNPGVCDWHHPPCPGDDIEFAFRPLAQFGLAPQGILLPTDIAELLDNEHDQRRAEAAAEAARHPAVGRRGPATLCVGTQPAVGLNTARAIGDAYQLPLT